MDMKCRVENDGILTIITTCSGTMITLGRNTATLQPYQTKHLYDAICHGHDCYLALVGISVELDEYGLRIGTDTALCNSVLYQRIAVALKEGLQRWIAVFMRTMNLRNCSCARLDRAGLMCGR